MEPFICLHEYPFAICKECKIACGPNEIASHLRSKHSSVKLSEWLLIAKYVEEIPGIIKQQRELREFKFPPPTIHPSFFIAPPETDGLRCVWCV